MSAPETGAPNLAQLVRIGLPALRSRHGHQLTPAHHQALTAIQHCRTGTYGSTLLHCTRCDQRQYQLRSCGHRSCPQCQHHTSQQWLERQQAKLLPVTYFLVTFTVPAELRGLCYRNQALAYDCLFRAAAATLASFGANHKQLNSRLGGCAVLHTHSRRLDYHPHLHVVVPGGGVNAARKQFRKLKGRYLFNGRQLATVFRAKLIDALNRQGVVLPGGVPKHWVVHCEKVGNGLPALKYLSRYLYRGVIAERDIVAYEADRQLVTFRYRDGKTKSDRLLTLPLVDFLWGLMMHVLPKGYRRVRDYGFLHGNAKRLLKIVQLLLSVRLPTPEPRSTRPFRCRDCGQPMTVIGIIPGWRPT